MLDNRYLCIKIYQCCLLEFIICEESASNCKLVGCGHQIGYFQCHLNFVYDHDDDPSKL